ncbi:MAG: hypothetical protein QM811_05635 [Pirellulales bacterium]
MNGMSTDFHRLSLASDQERTALILQGKIEGETVRLRIDTGTGVDLIVYESFAAKLKKPLSALGKTNPDLLSTNFDSVDLGGGSVFKDRRTVVIEKKEKQDIVLADGTRIEVDGVIGIPYLSRRVPSSTIPLCVFGFRKTTSPPMLLRNVA